MGSLLNQMTNARTIAAARTPAGQSQQEEGD
jgi:hypothetical protein